MKQMGRPKMGKEAKTIIKSVRFTEEEIKQLNSMSNYLEIPLMVLIRNLTLTCLEDAELLKKAGVLELAKGIKQTSEAIEKFKSIKQTQTL